MARRIAPMDAETIICEDLTLTASGVVQKGGVDRILKIGKGQSDFSLVIDVETIETDSGNELFTFLLQGSEAANMGAPVENLAILQLGHTSVRLGGARTSPAGRYIVPVSNHMPQADTGDWTYVHLRLIVGGTVATGIKFSAWLTRKEIKH